MSAVKLGDLMAERVVGIDPQRFPAEEFELWSIPAFDAGRPEVVSGAEIGSAKKLLAPGDVLLSKIVPHIRRAWVVQKSSGSRQIGSGEWIVFRSPKFEPGYLRHFLTSDEFHTKFMGTIAGVGGSLMRARPEAVREFVVSLPPLGEQRRIAAILDQADAVRRKRTATIKACERFVEATFAVQFGGGNARDTASLGDLFEITRGGSPRPIDAYLTDDVDGLNWVSISDATANGKFIRSVKRRIKPAGASKSRRVEPGDFLLTNSMSFGRPYIMATTGYIHDGWLSLRPKDSRINQEYLYRALSSPETYAQFARLASGATVKNLNIELVRTVRIPVPDRALQNHFAEIASAMDIHLKLKRDGLQRLDALFASLQHRAFTGELTRSDERLLETA